MSSPINPTGGNKPTPVSRVNGTSSVGAAGSESVNSQNSGTAATDSVHLTGNAMQLQNLAQSISAMPVVDAQKVSDVRQAISSGQYVVDSKAIASKLLQFDHALAAR